MLSYGYLYVCELICLCMKGNMYGSMFVHVRVRMCGSMYVSFWKWPCQERLLVSQNVVGVCMMMMRVVVCVCMRACVWAHMYVWVDV